MELGSGDDNDQIVARKCLQKCGTFGSDTGSGSRYLSGESQIYETSARL